LQRDRTVAAVCLDARGRPYLLTAHDLRGLAARDKGTVRAGADLLEAIPVTGWKMGMAYDRREATDFKSGFDDAVYRARPDGQRIQGFLSAMHGLIMIRDGDVDVSVSGLLEIRFDTSDAAGMLPRLEPGDLGCLVSLASGQACGVLVAGADHIGFAVPLNDALTRMGLQLAEVPAVVADMESGLALGLDALRSEIGRDAEIDLGDAPVGLAA
jgi:hypothetical protein